MADRPHPEHARHDLEAVAALASGDPDDAQAMEARNLIDACDDCLQLSRDLRSLTLGLQSLPGADRVAATSRAPRDFRLTPETAARLRPASPVARLAGRITHALAAFGRPAGISLATLGLVGVLVGTANLGGPAYGGASTMELQSTKAPAGAPGAAGSTFDTAVLAPGATPAEDRTNYGPAASERDSSTPPAVDGSDLGAPALAGWLLVGSGVAIVVGVGLFVLGWMGRRAQSGG